MVSFLLRLRSLKQQQQQQALLLRKQFLSRSASTIAATPQTTRNHDYNNTLRRQHCLTVEGKDSHRNHDYYYCKHDGEREQNSNDNSNNNNDDHRRRDSYEDFSDHYYRWFYPSVAALTAVALRRTTTTAVSCEESHDNERDSSHEALPKMEEIAEGDEFYHVDDYNEEEELKESCPLCRIWGFRHGPCRMDLKRMKACMSTGVPTDDDANKGGNDNDNKNKYEKCKKYTLLLGFCVDENRKYYELVTNHVEQSISNFQTLRQQQNDGNDNAIIPWYTTTLHQDPNNKHTSRKHSYQASSSCSSSCVLPSLTMDQWEQALKRIISEGHDDSSSSFHNDNTNPLDIYNQHVFFSKERDSSRKPHIIPGIIQEQTDPTCFATRHANGRRLPEPVLVTMTASIPKTKQIEILVDDDSDANNLPKKKKVVDLYLEKTYAMDQHDNLLAVENVCPTKKDNDHSDMFDFGINIVPGFTETIQLYGMYTTAIQEEKEHKDDDSSQEQYQGEQDEYLFVLEFQKPQL